MTVLESTNGGSPKPLSEPEKVVEPKVLDDVPWWRRGPNAGLASFGPEVCKEVWEVRGIRPPDGVGCWMIGRMCADLDEASGNQGSEEVAIIEGCYTLDDLEDCFSAETEYVWRNHLIRGMPHIINGREGDGKTTQCIAIANEILNRYPQGVVIWVASEGRVQDTYKKARMLIEAKNKKRFILLRHQDGSFQFNFNLLRDQKFLDDTLAQFKEAGTQVVSVFVDSIRGISPFDDNDSKIKNVLGAVNRIVCEKHNACLVYLDHHKKSKASSLLDKSVGTTAKPSSVCRVFSVLPVSQYVRKFRLAKENIITDKPPSELDVIFANNKLLFRESLDQADLTKVAQVEEWLIKIFSERPTYKARDIYAAGEQGGFNVSTIKAAKKNLPIKTWQEKVGGPWYWTCEALLGEENGISGVSGVSGTEDSES